MLRTWSVRFDAIRFTFSVRSRHVPDTPSTSAWPPSLPSVPTSRATRVTSSANERSWSTIVLIVSLSSRISPWASTVIFCDRSPSATAVVTWAMLRTWSVRLPAMKFTFSVRSRHVPDTPLTSAWPPSLPSVPTSRATRVTSSANERELVDHRVDRSLELEDLALRVDRDLLLRSPLATAVVTCGDVAHLVGQVRRHRSSRTRSGPSTCRPRPAPRPGRRACPRCPPRAPRRVTCSANVRSVSVIDVDRLGQRRDLALGLDRDLLRQVAVGDRGRDLRRSGAPGRSGWPP